MRNKVRIGGGQWRSRLLDFPDVPGLRPTPDRVRQTLFNWLGQELHGLSCLDLFAGTGALGFEALSRQAGEVVMVENNPEAHRALLGNASTLNAPRIRIVHSDALQFLASNRQKFDLIFLDPPFGYGWLDRLFPLLDPHLAEDGVVYAESEHALVDTSGWRVFKHGRAGNVFYHLLQFTYEK